MFRAPTAPGGQHRLILQAVGSRAGWEEAEHVPGKVMMPVTPSRLQGCSQPHVRAWSSRTPEPGLPSSRRLGNLRSSLASLVITLQWGDLMRWCWGGWVAGARKKGPPKRPREAAVTAPSLTRWRGRPACEQGRGRLAVPGKVMI